MIEVRLYVDLAGRTPFARWFETLDAIAAAKVTVAVARMEQGNLSNAKAIGDGVAEYRIDFGPGYRLYFGRDGNTLIVLLGGGTKKRQDRDIDTAKERWGDYKRRKRETR
jgi:putative addiction module killer protein